jgi:predicted RNase H-like nuclease (RuvC/YqgF family)
MSATETPTKTETTEQKDVITRLADRGEDALQRLSELPGGQRALKAFNELRARVDELTKKVRGIDALEARIAKLEKELAAMKRAAKPKPAAKRPDS